MESNSWDKLWMANYPATLAKYTCHFQPSFEPQSQQSYRCEGPAARCLVQWDDKWLFNRCHRRAASPCRSTKGQSLRSVIRIKLCDSTRAVYANVWQHDASYCSYIAKHSGSLMKKQKTDCISDHTGSRLYWKIAIQRCKAHVTMMTTTAQQTAGWLCFAWRCTTASQYTLCKESNTQFDIICICSCVLLHYIMQRYFENLAALPSALTVNVQLSSRTSTSKGPEAAQHPWTKDHSQTEKANGVSPSAGFTNC